MHQLQTIKEAVVMQQRNSSSKMQPLAELPAGLLETLVPGYGTISTFLFETLGLDIALIVSVSFLLFTFVKSVDYLRRQSQQIVTQFLMCSIAVDSTSDAYHWMTNWLAIKGVGKGYSDLLAISNPRSMAWDVDGEFLLRLTADQNWNKPKVWYEPCLESSQYFWHKGHLFLWYRWKNTENRGYDSDSTSGKIEARIYCLGRSTVPIKALIKEALEDYEKQNASKTSIRRPAPSQRRKSGGHLWIKIATRPSRPMNTIVLDESDKKRILADIKEYLTRETRQWYAERGIPYRRGYLFYGPPGTGKTSLSFALAGVFNLDVYCISLAESSLTEEDLASLFDALPEQCLVLLEDIDSAGLAVRDVPTAQKSQPPPPSPKDEINEPSQNEDHPPSPTASQEPPAPPLQGRITLSGLLNVLDGVASQEGRLLIMTTNDVASLDTALLRPGRIDMRIQFDLATRKDAEGLFIQMFTTKHRNQDRLDGEADDVTKDVSSGTRPIECAAGNIHGRKESDERAATLKSNEIVDMAHKFAEKIPDKGLSAADIQGYLMMYKSRPDEALTDVEQWVASRK